MHNYDGTERRKSLRHPCVENLIELEWHDRDEMQRTTGRILNVTDGGALLLSNPLPGFGQRLYVRMKRPIRTDWVEVKVIRQVAHQKKVAIVFGTACPYDLVLGAALGIDISACLFGSLDGNRFSTAAE